MGKLKDCEIIGEWSQSIINHLYWSVASTNEDDTDVMIEKWLSLANHIHNVHKGHGKRYKNCAHEQLKKRKWFKYRKFTQIVPVCLRLISYYTDTKASEKIIEAVTNKRLCNNIVKLSTYHQTSYLESFHSLINHFAPKQYAFSYKSMLARYI
jgi:hypothetical protein